MWQLQESNSASSSLPPENLSRRFSLDEILAATNDFDDSLVIGQGGFAKVYKGEIDNGAHTVAVKRMKPMSKEGAPEFRSEILTVSKFRHSHLVSLIGYCESENEMILIYEYMGRGTLEDNLHKIGTSGNNNLPLSWVQRLKICIGAARGLEYLHTGIGIQHRVIHRDVKSSNILLDENWAAKISDFGMSKIGPANQSDTHVNTRVVGTFGYLDPNYAFTGCLTRKSDVYSFGVVLFEVLCGRPALDRRLLEDQWGLAGWVQYCIKKGIVKQIIDPNLKSQIVPRSLLAFVKVADRCLQGRPKERPTMNEVLTNLELALNLQESTEVARGFAEKFRLLFSVTPQPISVHGDPKPSRDRKSKNNINESSGSVNKNGGVVQLVPPSRHLATPSSVQTAQACKDNKNDNSSGGNSTIPNKDGVGVLQVPPSGQIVTQKLKVFTFAELKIATRNFRPDTLLGEGGFGKVFRGWVSEETYGPSKPGIGTIIAVKILHPESPQGFEEWKSEVELLGRYTHPNLVKLLGYCMEDRDLLIVYEYMQRGSLENHIFRRKGGEPLPWATRLKIATGAARGLAFLHTAEKQVIYGNFKSSNILLDMEFNPKLSDFGLSKLAPLEETHISTQRMGTDGYAAPEYVATGHLSVKSDVYRFGVVLLEMFTGMWAFDVNRFPGKHNLIDYAKPLLRDKRKLGSLVDPHLDGDYPPKGAFRLAALALCCLEPSPQARPPMTEVVETLEQIQHLTDIRQKKSHSMLSLQNNLRQLHLQQQQQQQMLQVARVSYNGDHRDDSFVLPSESAISSGNLRPLQGVDSREVDEEVLLGRAHQDYKTGNYKQALEHSKTVYERNPQRTDNLLLLGAVYYQLHDFDMCIAKNEEALRIDPHFAECYGNKANAWKEKGNIDAAIHYYLNAIELRPNFADAWSNLASAHMRKGRLNEAAQCCRQALALNPRLVDAHSNLGNLMKAQGLVQEAYNCYVEALRIQPNFAIARSNLAGLFMETGDLNRAVQYYKKAVKIKPTFSDAYLNMGNVYKALGMPQDAILCYQGALQTKPDYAMAFANLGSVYYEQGNLDMAILHYKRAIACDAGFLEAYNNLGNALKDAGKVEEAIHCYRQCLSLQPSHPQALTNLGNIYNNLAIIYKQQGNYGDAISCYNEVLRIDPLAADGLVNRGNTFKEIGRVNEAIQDLAQAIAIRPTMAEGHANLASAYKDSGHIEVSIKSYKLALILLPDFPEATCNLLFTLQCVCDWSDRKKMFIEVEGILRRQIKMSVIPSVQPYHAIAYPLDPMLALEISRKYAQHCSVMAGRYSLPPFSHPPPLTIKGGGRSARLRVGYVSSDFGNHPLSHLMGSVFGMHDREHVEVFCYALSPCDCTEWRMRIQSEAEHFIDVSAMSSDKIARLINEDQIQILINLNGYTKGARIEIFAMQPAPVQVSYMGFPGTTGATYIHYLVTDEFVSPTHFSNIYSEKLVHLPHCYFVNDHKQKHRDVLDPNCPHKRSDYGLPEDKFIFACFNQLYKMDPEIVMTWCNILKRIPNSVLWLLRFPAAGEMRFRAYVSAQGVQPDQIIFTDVAMKGDHIRRISLADLFLDTPLCNAHTSGTDVLWAGLPMVTLPLEKMATRVAGSLCLATGLGEEMIVHSMKEYEEKAVGLALNRPKLQDLTNRLKASRLTCPLFDTSRGVKNLERAYFKMWNLYCSGQHPQPFKVTENDSEFPSDR